MAKSTLQQSLEIFYIVFIVIHLVVSVPFNFIPLYPTWLVPDAFKEFVKSYSLQTNDVWFGAT
jgi:hypothetical protein